MIGIRRHNDAAIDLWCGDRDHFVADVHSESAAEGFEQATRLNLRHLAISPFHDSASVDLAVFFENLKQMIDARPSQSPSRITVIADDLLRYQGLQIAMYETFSVAPCE